MERKKDLDNTKEKMDKLVEKLYLGRSAILPKPMQHPLLCSHVVFISDAATVGENRRSKPALLSC